MVKRMKTKVSVAALLCGLACVNAVLAGCDTLRPASQHSPGSPNNNNSNPFLPDVKNHLHIVILDVSPSTQEEKAQAKKLTNEAYETATMGGLSVHAEALNLSTVSFELSGGHNLNDDDFRNSLYRIPTETAHHTALATALSRVRDVITSPPHYGTYSVSLGTRALDAADEDKDIADSRAIAEELSSMHVTVFVHGLDGSTGAIQKMKRALEPLGDDAIVASDIDFEGGEQDFWKQVGTKIAEAEHAGSGDNQAQHDTQHDSQHDTDSGHGTSGDHGQHQDNSSSHQTDQSNTDAARRRDQGHGF